MSENVTLPAICKYCGQEAPLHSYGCLIDLLGKRTTEVIALRSSLEKAKGEMRGMVRVDVLERWMVSMWGKINHQLGPGTVSREVDALVYEKLEAIIFIRNEPASRSEGEHHD